MPKLQTLDGGIIKHTNAILRRIAHTVPECGLMGCSFFEESAIDSWLEWGALEVDHTVLDANPVDGICDVLEPHLKSRTFLVGQRLSVADVSIALSIKASVDKV